MTAAHLTVAHCGEVSALTLGLPASAAIPEQKGTLPKGLFVAKVPVSSKLKQRLVNDIASITMLALLRPANTAMGAGSGKIRGAGDWPAREHARHPRRGDRSDRRTA